MCHSYVFIIPGIQIIARNHEKVKCIEAIGIQNMFNFTGCIVYVWENEKSTHLHPQFPIAYFPVLFPLFDGMENCTYGSMSRTEFCISFAILISLQSLPQLLGPFSMSRLYHGRSESQLIEHWPQLKTDNNNHIYFWYWIDCNRIVLYCKIHPCTSFSMFQRSRPWFITSYDKSYRITVFKYNQALMNGRSLPRDCVFVCIIGVRER